MTIVKVNFLIILAIVPIAFLALAGVATAISVNVDTIQTNGNYIGVPTIINGETYTYGYNYTLVPDGTYTIMGTATNDQNTPVDFEVNAADKQSHAMLGDTTFTVPAASSSRFSFTVKADSLDEFYVGWGAFIGKIELGEGQADLSNTDYIDAPSGVHTIDEGPMSGMSVIYNNGVLSSNATVIYSLNVTGDDYKALYTNGKIDFKGSPLYSFVE